MIIDPGFIGIDVSQATLDIFDSTSGQSRRIDNSEGAISALIARWHGQDRFVLFEATGRYDTALRQALSWHSVPFARVNPGQARDFARAAGFLAKTDAVDARMLAAMAKALRPRPTAPNAPEHEHLTQLVRRRDQIVAMRAQEKTRLKQAQSDQEHDDIKRHITWLTNETRGLDNKIAKLIASHDSLKNDVRRLRTAPGIGPVAATVLVALMPELGHRSPKTIAALAGLAPINNDSGRYRGKRHIAGGRRRVRAALYMAAVAAMRSSQRFSAQYNAMIENGKPPKVALIAIARKLIVILNAMQRQQAKYAT